MTVKEQMLAYIGEHPGCTTAQISKDLGVPTNQLRQAGVWLVKFNQIYPIKKLLPKGGLANTWYPSNLFVRPSADVTTGLYSATIRKSYGDSVFWFNGPLTTQGASTSGRWYVSYKDRGDMAKILRYIANKLEADE